MPFIQKFDFLFHEGESGLRSQDVFIKVFGVDTLTIWAAISTETRLIGEEEA